MKKEAGRYIRELSHIAGKANDVVGFVFCINGEINSADIYSHNKLFLKLWPKMLEASAIEAVSEYEQGFDYETLSSRDIRNWLEDVESGRKSPKSINRYTDARVIDNEDYYMMETYDEKDKDNWVHKNMIKK
ncbi:MAG: hypothetical protein PHF84_02765 [bacterium]|nr:hypothetical protein [bacterium]